MRLSVPRENTIGETRIPLIPEHAKRLVQAGFAVSVASGLGKLVGFSDEEYRLAGAEVLTDHEKLLGEADIILRIHKPAIDEIPKLKKGCIYISLLDPFNEREIIAEFAKQGVSAVCSQFSGQSGRICGGDHCRGTPEQSVSHDDYPCRHH